MLQDSTCAC